VGAQGRDADRAAELEAVLKLEPQSARLAKELVVNGARARRWAGVLWAAPVAIFIDPADAEVHDAWARALAPPASPPPPPAELAAPPLPEAGPLPPR